MRKQHNTIYYSVSDILDYLNTLYKNNKKIYKISTDEGKSIQIKITVKDLEKFKNYLIYNKRVSKKNREEYMRRKKDEI